MGQFSNPRSPFGVADKGFFGTAPIVSSPPPASGLWVLVGFTAALPTTPQAATSPDLQTWTLENLGFSEGDSPNGVGFFDGAFIAWSANGDISVRDPSTSTWNLVTNPVGKVVAMAASATRIVALCYTTEVSTQAVPIYSDDGGQTFTSGTTLTGNVTAVCMTYGNGLFAGWIANNDDEGALFPCTSSDGITFEIGDITVGSDSAVFGAQYGNGTYLVFGFSGAQSGIETSPDGVTYTDQMAPSGGFPNTGINSFIFDGENFFVGSNGVPFFWITPDGVNYTGVDDSDPVFINSVTVIANNGTTLYLAADNDTPPNVASSPSAAAWVSTAVAQPLDSQISAAAFGS